MKSLTRAADLYEKSGDQPSLAFALQFLGTRQEIMGDLERAKVAYDRSLAISRAAGDRIGEANALLSPAMSTALRGDTRQGIEMLDRVLGVSAVKCPPPPKPRYNQLQPCCSNWSSRTTPWSNACASTSTPGSTC
ncbi:hypothetical protein SBA4_4750011 [Candidatus Sulfopaludibacter sp. SbA4]|nr:hypothetical protein SBA4_4750011 [Candidatus Sulfopaludibacter sp. SbA4]